MRSIMGYLRRFEERLRYKQHDTSSRLYELVVDAHKAVYSLSVELYCQIHRRDARKPRKDE
ncbi:hypothetical protein [Paludisphaera rhizosphaerae]|uniref:hypothetical protein n=2 Tax=Paludisphaera rhizosphaerae TaxID=2711216 RepID=UPI00197E4640|nr:hypothetical protein [Paludisphaera rhizosphaerae]